MAHHLGTLAAWAPGHWKRSLAIVAGVLVSLGIAAAVDGGSFVDDFTTPGSESPSAIDLQDDRFAAASGDTATMLGAFPNLQASVRGSVTVLTGELPDRSALHGVLAQVEALNLWLLGVQRREPAEPQTTTPIEEGASHAT